MSVVGPNYDLTSGYGGFGSPLGPWVKNEVVFKFNVVTDDANMDPASISSLNISNVWPLFNTDGARLVQIPLPHALWAGFADWR